MKNESFYPKITVDKTTLVFNVEAIETMDLDQENASVVIIETTNPEKTKNNKEILIIKTNGSLCDSLDNIKDVFPPDHVRKVNINKEEDEVVNGMISVTSSTIEAIQNLFGKDVNELKLLACNTESALAKEFKDMFNISNTYYKFANVNDKRICVGKEKNMKTQEEEKVKLLLPEEQTKNLPI